MIGERGRYGFAPLLMGRKPRNFPLVSFELRVNLLYRVASIALNLHEAACLCVYSAMIDGFINRPYSGLRYLRNRLPSSFLCSEAPVIVLWRWRCQVLGWPGSVFLLISTSLVG